MRLSKRLLKIIKEALNHSFQNLEVYLFGSRIDDSKIGGDIDLAVKTSMNTKEFRKQKTKFITFLFSHGYDLKIDIVQFSSKTDKLLFEEIKSTAIKI